MKLLAIEEMLSKQAKVKVIDEWSHWSIFGEWVTLVNKYVIIKEAQNFDFDPYSLFVDLRMDGVHCSGLINAQLTQQKSSSHYNLR